MVDDYYKTIADMRTVLTLDEVLDILKPMGELTQQKDESGRIELLKDGTKFCVYDGKDFYLVDKNYEYMKLMSYVLADHKTLLVGAQTSLERAKQTYARGSEPAKGDIGKS